MTASNSSALDIIYSLPEKIDILVSKVSALEARNSMLESKLNALLLNMKPSDLPETSRDFPYIDVAETSSSDSEVMEVRSPFPRKTEEPSREEKAIAPMSLDSFKQERPAIKIPARDVDPMPAAAIPAEKVSEKQPATLVRGRLKEREGSSIAAVDVKIFDEKSVMVKKTKTAATGEWIAMLPPGEYTAEFTKPGQKPLFKPISIVSGKKELEILI